MDDTADRGNPANRLSLVAGPIIYSFFLSQLLQDFYDFFHQQYQVVSRI